MYVVEDSSKDKGGGTSQVNNDDVGLQKLELE